MVEVFKTDVQEHHQAMMLEGVLAEHFPLHRINFDIEDCDRILRVEGAQVLPLRIIELVKSNGYHCCLLDDC